VVTKVVGYIRVQQKKVLKWGLKCAHGDHSRHKYILVVCVLSFVGLNDIKTYML